MRNKKAPVAVVATRGPVDQPAGKITSDNNSSKPRRTQRRNPVTEKLIAAIKQGEMADLRVRLDIWQDRPRIDIRIYNGPPRERRPTIRGFCIRPGQLKQVITALLAAKREAVALGWLSDEGEPK